MNEEENVNQEILTNQLSQLSAGVTREVPEKKINKQLVIIFLIFGIMMSCDFKMTEQ